MIYHYKKQQPEIIPGGAGDGTKSNPWYWYSKIKNQNDNTIIQVNNQNSSDTDAQVYIRVKLNAGTNYGINEHFIDGDSYLRFYDENGNYINQDDDGGWNSYDSYVSYTPSTTGIFLIGAGSYSGYSRGNIEITMNPAPEYDPVPQPEIIYYTSTGFNDFGKAIKYRSAELAGLGFLKFLNNSNLISLITKNSFDIDAKQNKFTIKNINSLDLDGIDDYLVSKVDINLLNQFSFAIKFIAYGNGCLVGMQSQVLPENNADSYCPLICITDSGFVSSVWTGSEDTSFSYNQKNIKNKINTIVICKNSSTMNVYLNKILVGTISGGLNISWAKQYSLGCGYYSSTSSSRPSGGTGNWHHINCSIQYSVLYNKFLTEQEVLLIG